MNGHNIPIPADMRGAHILNGPQDSRFERIKLVQVGLDFLIQLLGMDGTFGLRFDGLPEGAQVLSAVVLPAPGASPQIMITLHKPDWPIVLAGVQPEILPIRFTAMHWTPEGMSENKPEEEPQP